MKKKLSIIFRDPDEIPHRKGILHLKILKPLSIGVNSIIIDNKGINLLKIHL